jgi:hypothetical protein
MFTLEQEAKCQIEQLLFLAAKQNPELSRGLCRRLVVDVLRAELDRLQEWDKWPADSAARREVNGEGSPSSDCGRAYSWKEERHDDTAGRDPYRIRNLSPAQNRWPINTPLPVSL